MIYTRFGDKVTILANCGRHRPEDFQVPCQLVKVRIEFEDSDKAIERYRFVEFLKADGGIAEIQAAVDESPRESLKGNHLQAAITQAS